MSLTFSKQTFAQQLAQQLEETIRLGQWPAGEQTPPIRKVAEKYLVSTRTAQVALKDLQDRGLLIRQPSGRTIVSDTVDTKDSSDSSAATQVPVQQIAM